MDYFYLSSQQKAYLEEFMNKVSRSFALVTPCFEEPLDSFMSVAYLICRVVDNIEDCKQPFSWQHNRFSEFKALLQEPAHCQEILSIWSQENWIGLDFDQTKLMQPEGGLMLWQIYGLIPDESRATIQAWTLAMAEGMEKMLDPQKAPHLVEVDGVSLLNTEEDYNSYCYFVAGTVGRMGTELAIKHYQLNSDVAEDLRSGSETCGRALQKTNIVKDFAEDLERGLCFLPKTWVQEVDGSPLHLDGASSAWTQKVLMNVKAELDESVAYVMGIPFQAFGYRLASLMCLLPAYQTLLSAVQQHSKLFTPDHHVKISRSCFSQCFEDAKLMAQNNDALLEYSECINQKIDDAFQV